MPALVTGEGEPYHPETLLWLCAEGAIVGSRMARPGEVLGMASESLSEAIERPLWGRPHRPRRVRVSSPELAAALRAANTGIEIVCAPTPELDEVLAEMREALKLEAAAEAAEAEGGSASPQSYLSAEVSPELVAGFFRAAARLFRAQPWAVAPNDQSLLLISIEKLRIKDAALAVVGQEGDHYALLLFPSVEHFEDYVAAGEAIMRRETPELPFHMTLSYEHRDELDESLRREIEEHGWEVASENAYPWLLSVQRDLVAQQLTLKDIRLFEALTLALPEVLPAKAELLEAWNGGEPFAQTVTVPAHGGDLDVSVRVHASEASKWMIADQYLPPANFNVEEGLLPLRGSPERWIWAFTCPVPDCDCRTALVVSASGGREKVREVGSPVAEAWGRADDHRFAAARLRGVTAFALDLDTAEACPPISDEPFDLDDQPEVKAIVERLDDDVLDRIARVWHRGKGEKIPEDPVATEELIELPDWKPDDLVAWDVAHSVLRTDAYVVGDDVYEAVENYCVQPNCDCCNLLVNFVSLSDEDAEPIGSVEFFGVKVEGQKEAIYADSRHDEAIVAELWSAYRQRHPRYRERFVERAAVMHGLAGRFVPERIAPPKPKVGRNDACPCGSGKKYKKCCGLS